MEILPSPTNLTPAMSTSYLCDQRDKESTIIQETIPCHAAAKLRIVRL
uniref:Uncharacterized protein n=1 Tax=Anguilla anguilla TaxID=7936 RepID=A0A0E9T8K7_ANGAN